MTFTRYIQCRAALVALFVTLGVMAFAVPRAVAAALTPEQESAYQEAVAFWGVWPDGPPACATVIREAVSEAEIGGMAGNATQPHPGESGLVCHLRVAVELLPCDMRAVMRHEVGHLLGYGHSTDPDNVMYAHYQDPACTPLDSEIAHLKNEIRFYRHEVREARGHVRRGIHRCHRFIRRRRKQHCWEEVRAYRWIAHAEASELPILARELAELM